MHTLLASLLPSFWVQILTERAKMLIAIYPCWALESTDDMVSRSLGDFHWLFPSMLW